MVYLQSLADVKIFPTLTAFAYPIPLASTVMSSTFCACVQWYRMSADNFFRCAMGPDPLHNCCNSRNSPADMLYRWTHVDMIMWQPDAVRVASFVFLAVGAYMTSSDIP